MDALIVVPPEGTADLEKLATQLAIQLPLVNSKQFDGLVMVQMLLPVTLVSISALKGWLLARIERQRTQEVVINGRRFKAYSAKDVERILGALDAAEGQSDESPEVE